MAKFFAEIVTMFFLLVFVLRIASGMSKYVKVNFDKVNFHFLIFYILKYHLKVHDMSIPLHMCHLLIS